MRLNGLFRRARRLKITTVWSSLYHLFEPSSTPIKHIKIDDEERGYGEQPDFIRRPRSTLVIMTKLFLLLLLILVVLAVLIAYIVYKPPTSVINYFQWKNPNVLFHHPLPSSQRVVALTLDDAPSSETVKILDHLKTYGAKATFFIIGSQISEHPGIVQRIHDEGHEIGNHAWRDEPSFKLSLTELERQVKEVESLVPSNTNGSKWFRPGSGWFNQGMVEKLRGLGYTMVLGSIYPHDPNIPHPKVNAAHVLSMVKPGGIIIMHDRRSYSPEQLELVLKGLTADGWRIETVSGLQKIAAEIQGKKIG